METFGIVVSTTKASCFYHLNLFDPRKLMISKLRSEKEQDQQKANQLFALVNDLEEQLGQAKLVEFEKEENLKKKDYEIDELKTTLKEYPLVVECLRDRVSSLQTLLDEAQQNYALQRLYTEEKNIINTFVMDSGSSNSLYNEIAETGEVLQGGDKVCTDEMNIAVDVNEHKYIEKRLDDDTSGKINQLWLQGPSYRRIIQSAAAIVLALGLPLSLVNSFSQMPNNDSASHLCRASFWSTLRQAFLPCWDLWHLTPPPV
ncbi:uncharacterized protein [Heptranchias perlo]|uniref:uncharacterized protein n=1 Tax=Heptranchias perlo TaxID=212740 RepID=UPI003559B967